MKTLIFLSLLASSVSFAQGLLSDSSSRYYGKVSTEAILEFTTVAEIPHSTNLTLTSLKGAKVREKILEKLDLQIQHLMGTFQSASFIDEFSYPGVLGATYDIEFLSVKNLTAKRKEIEYKFKGKVVFHSGAFKNKNTVELPLKLPRAYDEIYELGMKGATNKCTDHHYNSEGDFWYFWDPDMDGCPLADNDTDVLRFNGKLKRLENTKLTYPEYDMLYGNNGNGKVMKTSIFLGYIDDLKNLTTVNRQDNGYYALEYIEEALDELGYTVTEKKDAFREYADGRTVKGINFYRIYSKEITTKTGDKITSEVELMLSDTDINSEDGTFHNYLIPAMIDSDIIAYDGHSGLGANLSLDWLPTFSFKPKKYQMIYFNGCSSYPYFNGNYFDAKGGTKYMDLLTSGLPTLTDTSGPNMMAFVEPFLKGSVQSYQKLLSQIELSNGENDTYLVGVNGDEDNVFQP